MLRVGKGENSNKVSHLWGGAMAVDGGNGDFLSTIMCTTELEAEAQPLTNKASAGCPLTPCLRRSLLFYFTSSLPIT